MMRMVRDWGAALLIGALVYYVTDRLSRSDLQARGDPAAEFALESLDGGTVRLSELRGAIVVLNFWATWCGPCKAEIPEFSAFAKDNPSVHVLGLVVPSNEGDRLTAIVRRFPIAYPVLVADQATTSAYGVRSFPTTYVVRADGTISGIQVGGLSRRMLERLVREAG
jgi:thiol-disulfide isomerase/thioredoxin